MGHQLDVEELRRHLDHLLSDPQGATEPTDGSLEEIRMASLFSWDAKDILKRQSAEFRIKHRLSETAFNGEYLQYSVLGRELQSHRPNKTEKLDTQTFALESSGSDNPDDTPSETSLSECQTKLSSPETDSDSQHTEIKPIYLNTDAPFSAFVCGSQGSGKSHTLSCILENCLLSREKLVRKIGKLPKPAAGIVFHYDPHGGICEAAHLSSSGIRVRVFLTSRSQKLRAAYKDIRDSQNDLTVEDFSLQYEHLNVENMLDLMGFDETDSAPPLYLTELVRVLREIYDQSDGDTFSKEDYGEMKKRMDDAGLTAGQIGPLRLRFLNLESYLPKETVRVKNKKTEAKPDRRLNDFLRAAPGTLTIIDLSDPFTSASTACTLFRICLDIFLTRSSPNDRTGRVIALDEAHKYMHDTVGATKFTDALLSAIRMQRHVGARIVIATQEPTVSHKLLDLCSITIVHRFTSPDWFDTLRSHVAGLSSAGGNGDHDIVEIFSEILNLGVGESLVFSPSALLKIVDGKVSKVGNGYVKVKIRPRLSSDGGKSLYAVKSH